MRVVGPQPHRMRRPVRPGLRLVFATLVLITGLGLGAPVAAAATTSSPVQNAPQSARLADLLRRDPVYVSDQMPRDVPPSTAPEFARLAAHTGVPTYVLVLPDQDADGKALLGAVHDRLGRDGLYVLVGSIDVDSAVAFGVNVPTDDASDIALYSLPYDAGPLAAFRAFTGAVAEGADRAARQADVLRAEYGNTGKHVPDAYIDNDDRENQAFLTGYLLLGVPVLILLTGFYLRRQRRRRPGAGGIAVRLTKGARAPAGGSRRGPVAEAVAAVLVAVLVAVGAPHVFTQKYNSAPVSPTPADLAHRLDRVTAGLREDPVYTDPESPRLLTAAQETALEHRIAAFKQAPVFVTLVPSQPDDESGGNTDAYLAAVHRRLGRAGVYVAADPFSGDITLDDWGVRLNQDELSFGLPTSIAYEDPYHSTDDHRMDQRLNALMTLLDKTPTTATPGDSYDEERAEPLQDDRLPSLFGGDFGPGLAMGALSALVLLGLLALGFRTARTVRAARLRGADIFADPAADGHHDAPSAPSAGYLRRTARHELDALAAEFDAADQFEDRRVQAYDCLDVALLLADRDPDGHLEADAEPADLVAAIVLARAGRAALAGRPTRYVCCLNPLHGPATGKRPARRGRPVCAACETAGRRGEAHPGRHDRALVLPGADGPVPYESAGGPLPAVAGGITRLIAKAREYASVQ